MGQHLRGGWEGKEVVVGGERREREDFCVLVPHPAIGFVNADTRTVSLSHLFC